MRFLVDNALPPRLALLLAQAGHDATHICDYGMQSAKDELVLARAVLENRIIVSADTGLRDAAGRHGGISPLVRIVSGA